MKSATRVSLVYILLSVLWIIFSDRLVLLLAPNPEWMTQVSILKGSFYVLVIAGFLYWIISREMQQKQSMIEELGRSLRFKNELISELHHRVKNNLQFINSLIHLETDQHGYTEESFDHIESRIIAMSSIHNIVYLDCEMEHLSLKRVLEGYFDLFSDWREMAEFDIPGDMTFDLEKITSLVLLFNELLLALAPLREGDGMADIRRFRLSAPSPEVFECRFYGASPASIDRIVSTIDAHDGFRVFLDALQGSMESRRESDCICYSFLVSPPVTSRARSSRAW